MITPGSGIARGLWLALGGLSMALGLIGAVLPLLPTVPFLILSAFCFGRSSQRLRLWLVSHRHFGPPIRDWQRAGAISRRAKWLALASCLVAFAISLMLGVRPVLLVVQLVALTGAMLFVWTRPEPVRRRG
ncbi:MAG: DUF454 domain-containing protein [Alphaproteobacteria bacterium]|nr:MAG: DUF454 domain-containing protein [Alphaproteobacteria bacterium]